MRSTRGLLVIVGAAVLAIPSSAIAQDPTGASPGSATTVVPAGGEPLGVPYPEWASRWWTWYTGIPATEDPGSTGDCQAGQGGDVFFVPQTYLGNTFETDCQVGARQWILASAGGTLRTNSEGESDAELRALVDANEGVLTDPAVIVDGIEVTDTDSYWVVSPAFDIDVIEDNVFGAEPGAVVRAMAGGWFVMIPPLEPGRHEVVVKQDFDDPSDDQGPVTAQLTARIGVAPAGPSLGLRACGEQPSGTIVTIAGIGDHDTGGALDRATGDGGLATLARMDGPFRIDLDDYGGIQVLEDAHHDELSNEGRVRRIDFDGRISTVVGPPTEGAGAAPGKAGSLALSAPWGMARDGSGGLFVSGGRGNRISYVDADGAVTRIAGGGGDGSSGDGGPATKAKFLTPRDLALDAKGNLYVADVDDHRVRRIDRSGIVTTFAGTGQVGFSGDGGPATRARLRDPSGLAVDGDGNVFIVDEGYGLIRMVDELGIIRTVAGGGMSRDDGIDAKEASLASPLDVWVAPDGALYVAETGAHRIRAIDTSGIITTVAGTGSAGFSGDGGPATSARLDSPSSAMVGPDGVLYVVDYENARIRAVCP